MIHRWRWIKNKVLTQVVLNILPNNLKAESVKSQTSREAMELKRREWEKRIQLENRFLWVVIIMCMGGKEVIPSSSVVLKSYFWLWTQGSLVIYSEGHMGNVQGIKPSLAKCNEKTNLLYWLWIQFSYF